MIHNNFRIVFTSMKENGMWALVRIPSWFPLHLWCFVYFEKGDKPNHKYWLKLDSKYIDILHILSNFLHV